MVTSFAWLQPPVVLSFRRLTVSCAPQAKPVGVHSSSMPVVSNNLTPEGYESHWSEAESLLVVTKQSKQADSAKTGPTLAKEVSTKAPAKSSRQAVIRVQVSFLRASKEAVTLSRQCYS